ncbi:MAG: HEAT repeat domain-containing protein [Candidatus Binatia bacterium]
MDNFLQQLLTLVEKGNIEQRCAVLIVLGALKVRQAQVMRAASAALGHPNPALKDFAFRYFEEVQASAGIPSLLRFLDDPDKEMQERAIRFLSRAGQSAVDPLLQAAATATRVWQLNAARVLCAVRGKKALNGLLRMLLSGTDEFNKPVCDLMIPVIREMDIKEQKQLYLEVEAFAAKLDANQQRAAAISAVRLLGQLGHPHARRWLFKLLGAENHSSLRTHALVALLRCLREEELRKDEHAKLISLLDEADFTEVTRRTLELLGAHPLPEDSRPLLSRLLQNRHEAVQKFALDKMGDFATPATVRTLIEQLGDSDYRRRGVAARSLHKIPEARASLIKELLGCEDPSKAWSIAELLPAYDGRWRQDTTDALWKRLEAAIAAQDRIQTAFLHVLKQAGIEYAYQQLATSGVKLIKAKRYKEALPFLTPLKDFPEFKPEDKFRFALAQLKSHSPAVAAHRQEPVVDLLRELYRNSAYPLFEAIKKEKNLTPDDLFYLGFTLVERSGEERNLGKDLLEHLASSFPRKKIGKSSKNKLKLLNW